MALLKGGTLVDGDLYVADSIVAHNIQDLDGKNFPYVDNEKNTGYQDRVVKFSNNTSGIVPTSASIKESADATTINFYEENNASNVDTTHKLTLGVSSNNLHITNAEIELDQDNQEWKFSLL